MALRKVAFSLVAPPSSTVELAPTLSCARPAKRVGDVEVAAGRRFEHAGVGEPRPSRSAVRVPIPAELSASIVPLLVSAKLPLPIIPVPSITSALVRVSQLPSIYALPPPLAVVSVTVPPPRSVVAPVTSKIRCSSVAAVELDVALVGDRPECQWSALLAV